MESLLIKSIIGLVIVLSILIFIFLYTSNKKSKNKTVIVDKKEAIKLSLVELKRGIKNEKTTLQELNETLDLVLKDYPYIGTNDEQSLNIYMLILMALCRHPKTSTSIIIKFEKELVKLNPSYETEINKAVIAGLDSRSL